MAGRPAKAAPAVSPAQTPQVADETTQRAMLELAQRIHALALSTSRYRVRMNLATGLNRIPHPLGRACEGYTLTLSTAHAVEPHYIDRTNPSPETELWLYNDGPARVDVTVEVF